MHLIILDTKVLRYGIRSVARIGVVPTPGIDDVSTIAFGLVAQPLASVISSVSGRFAPNMALVAYADRYDMASPLFFVEDVKVVTIRKDDRKLVKVVTEKVDAGRTFIEPSSL